MIILGIDTSVKIASAAVAEYSDGKINILGKVRSDGIAPHSENLLPMIDSLLKLCGLTIGCADCFAVTNGPGSFTGIRIGVATVKGLAFGLESPARACCAAVSTLDAFKYAADKFIPREKYSKYIVCPCIDARRNQAYNALYLYDGGIWEKIAGDRIILLSELAEELNAPGLSVFPVYFYGDVKEEAIPAAGERFSILPFGVEDNIAEAVCRIAAEYAAQNTLSSPDALVPRYLIKTQAEREYTDFHADVHRRADVGRAEL